MTYENLLGDVMGIFESGDLPKVFAKNFLVGTANKPSAKWSAANRAIMFWHTDDARGYKAWAEAGRQVKKGAKSFGILGPIIKKVDGEDKLVGFRRVPVFRIEDTDVVDQKLWEQNLTNKGSWQAPPLAEVAKAYGVDINPVFGRTRGANGTYYQYAKRIELMTDCPAVFFHELAHHVDGLILQEKGSGLIPGQDPYQEIVAETVAAALCLLCDLPEGEELVKASAVYIAGYAQSINLSNVGAVQALASRIDAVLARIVEKAQEIQSPALCGVARA